MLVWSLFPVSLETGHQTAVPTGSEGESRGVTSLIALVLTCTENDACRINWTFGEEGVESRSKAWVSEHEMESLRGIVVPRAKHSYGAPEMISDALVPLDGGDNVRDEKWRASFR